MSITDSLASLAGVTVASNLDAPTGHQCSKCGSRRVIEIALESVHGQTRLKCQACNHNDGIIEAKWTRDPLARARHHYLAFGKFKGKVLGELESKPAGRSYILWLANVRSQSDAVQAASRAARYLVRHSRSPHR